MYANNDNIVQLSNERLQLADQLIFLPARRSFLLPSCYSFCSFAANRVKSGCAGDFAKPQCHPSRESIVRRRYTVHCFEENCPGMWTWLFTRFPTYVSWKYRMDSNMPSRLGASSAMIVARKSCTWTGGTSARTINLRTRSPQTGSSQYCVVRPSP